jgi:hypothetical protein
MPNVYTSGEVDALLAALPATTLMRHDGTLKVRESGAHITGLDIHGDLVIEAADVTVSHCRIRGTATSKILVAAFKDGADNSRLVGCHVEPDYPAADQVGVHGKLSVIDCEIAGTTDGINVHLAAHVAIVGNVIHRIRWWPESPHHGAEGTHSDGIQVFDVDGCLIAENRIMVDVVNTSAIMVSQNAAGIRNLHIVNNTILGSAPCAINIADKGKGAITGIVRGNRIALGYEYDVLVSAASKATVSVADNWRI